MKPHMLKLSPVLMAILTLTAAAVWAQPTNSPPAVPGAAAGSFQSLCFLLMSTLLGVGGQVARSVVGIKKEMDAAAAKNPKQGWSDWFDARQLIVSLLLGGTAGLLAGIMMLGEEPGKSYMVGCIAAGYAGSDFIEGFMSKNVPKT